MIESAVTIGLPAQIALQASMDKTEVVKEAALAVQNAQRPDLDELRLLIEELRLDARTTSSSHGSSSKPKVPSPSEFTGKRENWKTFTSHLSLFFTANATQYPSDTEKILFAISRLGDGSAFKYMEQYIPDFQKPAASRPMTISSYDTFMATMSENFGILNAHVVAEAQLRTLRQKGSAMEYTHMQ